MSFGGFVHIINWWYKLYLKRKASSPTDDEFYKRVMVEHTCPDCEGKKLKPQRFHVKVGAC